MISIFKTILSISGILLFQLLYLSGYAQTVSISGIINTYTSVTSIDYANNQLTVNSAAGFSIGKKAMIIQMKGVDMNVSNSSSFGDVISYNNTGKYEFLTICDISGNNIQFSYSIQNTYSTSNAVQLITVPEYINANITGVLSAAEWDGTTGGVLAFEVQNTLTFSDNIDLTGKGFRGAAYNNSSFACAWYSLQTGYYYDYLTGRGAEKGEGVTDYLPYYSGGKGSLVNGGGGGNDHNGGGGGGGNYAGGGSGGERIPKTLFYCKCYEPGVGGNGLNYSNAENRIFLAGGGGAGHGNNNQGTSGGDGGGMIIISANEIEGNNNSIINNGSAAPGTSGTDGAGGGGAGGTILLDVSSFSVTTLNIETKGGAGGNTNNGGGLDQCNGPGGGGSGGVLWISGASLPINVNTDYSGGTAGITTASSQSGCSIGGSNSATNGSNGGLVTGLSIPESVAPFGGCSALPIELLSFTGESFTGFVKLKWTTSFEVNNNYFVIERSSDGMLFEKIGVVRGAGSSVTSTLYEYNDQDPLLGYAYYRLKQVNYDKSYTYSHVISVIMMSSDGLEVIEISPNPTNNQLELKVKTNSEDKVTIELINMIGLNTFYKEMQLKNGLNHIKLMINNQYSGIYFVRIANHQKMIVKKLIKN